MKNMLKYIIEMLIKKFITFLLRELASTEMVIRTKYHFRCTFFAHIFHSFVLFANFYASVHSEFSVEWTALSPISLKSIQFSKTFEIQKNTNDKCCVFSISQMYSLNKNRHDDVLHAIKLLGLVILSHLFILF